MGYIDIQGLIDTMLPNIMHYASNIIMALLWLVIGWWIIVHLMSLVDVPMEKYIADISVRRFLRSFIGLLLKIVLLISVAGLLGLETTSLVATLGAAGIAVGLALQGSLSNFAGGLLLLTFKPFGVGDYIEVQGEEGTVDSISVLYTIITTIENKKITIPNGNLANGVMKNGSAYESRMIRYEVCVAYDTDIEYAKKIITGAINNYENTILPEKTFVGVKLLSDSSILLEVRGWCPTQKFVTTRYELLGLIKDALRLAKISIPFPQLVVHKV